ncbi:fasciclin domain-containing protein [Rhodanobacter thiooxydans]|uniref:fasciclin domain-containing protein n=1 Tax=Rhodanobacter thiooxydans TaxID=416169 RepID=UPI000D3B3717
MKTHSRMRTLAMGLSLALATAAAVPMAMAGQMNSSMSMQKTVMVGGAAMYPSKNIIENAVNSKDHTTLVAAVKAAGLVETLEGPGPFTVFAPTNEAFAALPAGTVDNLLKPENKATLTKVLTYHVVPGKYTAHDLAKLAKAHGGKAMLKTVEGDSITVAGKDGKWTVTDAKGNVANITIADVTQSNGEIFVIDKVLMP